MKLRFLYLFAIILVLVILLMGPEILSSAYTNLGNYGVYELMEMNTLSEDSVPIINSSSSLFSSAIKLNPGSTSTLLGFARLYLLQDDLNNAKNTLLQIQEDDNQIIAWLTGNVLYELGDRSAAFSYWKNAVPTRWIVDMAVQAAKDGDLEEAVALYKIALEVEPDYPNANYGLAATYAQLGKLELAEGYFLKAIELRPNNWWYHLHLAQTYDYWGRYQDAVEHYKIALSLVPGKKDIKARLKELEVELTP